MAKVPLLPVFQIVFFAFCAHVYSQEIDTLKVLSYFPMNVGNKWQFEKKVFDTLPRDTITTYINVEVLNDTIMPNGKAYRVVTGFGNILHPEDTAFVRIDTSNLEVYYYDQYVNENSCNQEINYFKLNLPDTSEYEQNYEVCDLLPIEYRKGFAQVGSLKDSANFQVYFVPAAGPVSSFQLFKGFGIAGWATGEGNSGAFAVLKAAVIGGIQYGDFIDAVDENEIMPSDFSLEQNFPNPFNASTVISYSIEKPNFINLVIYNVKGQEVRKLVSEFQQQGRNSVPFHASELPSGVYFYKLTVGDKSSLVRKMLLLK